MLNWKVLSTLAVGGVGLWAWLNPPVSAPLDWNVPRTVRTTEGRRYDNVTIRSLTSDGGVIVNHNGSVVKFPSGRLDEPSMSEIVRGNRGTAAQPETRLGQTMLNQPPTRVYYRPNVEAGSSTSSQGSSSRMPPGR